MSPVFGHGRLRLYLLKLLEESPKHGYEMIRLLQDRFLGVYSPSPGTIYPRLTRLEAEGLVSHEVLKGKKVYTLTDKGRAELERRMDELAELEEEISASAREFAREVQEDVRQTVRSLRDELTQAAREMREQGRRAPADAGCEGRKEQEEWLRQRTSCREQKQTWKQEWRRNWDDARKTATGSADEVSRLKLERLLRRFVEDVRTAATEASLDEAALATARTVLDETLRRLRKDVLRTPGAPDTPGPERPGAPRG